MKDYFDMVYKAYQADSERFWKLFQSMTIVNAGLFSLVNIFNKTGALLIITSCMGAIICLIWAGIQWRYGKWCEWFDRKLGSVEKEYLKSLPSLPLQLNIFQEHSTRNILNASFNGKFVGISSRKWMPVIPMVFGLGWIALFVYKLFQLISSTSVHIPIIW